MIVELEKIAWGRNGRRNTIKSIDISYQYNNYGPTSPQTMSNKFFNLCVAMKMFHIYCQSGPVDVMRSPYITQI